jgi:predicted nucleic acid-binding protein
VPNDVLAPLLAEIVGFPGIVIEHGVALTSALKLWQTQGPLSFADCFHLTLTRELGMTEIYTFDRKMDRFPSVEQLKP